MVDGLYFGQDEEAVRAWYSLVLKSDPKNCARFLVTTYDTLRTGVGQLRPSQGSDPKDKKEYDYLLKVLQWCTIFLTKRSM